MTLTLAKSTPYALARSSLATYPLSDVPTLGENILRLRLTARHTNAAAFARSIGITAATLKDWESGRYKNLRLDSLLRVARGIPCAIDDLLVGVDATYDQILSVREDSSYTGTVAETERQKNASGVTSLVPVHGVQDELPGHGGSSDHAAQAARDRLPQSHVVADAEAQEDN